MLIECRDNPLGEPGTIERLGDVLQRTAATSPEVRADRLRPVRPRLYGCHAPRLIQQHGVAGRAFRHEHRGMAVTQRDAVAAGSQVGDSQASHGTRYSRTFMPHAPPR